MLNPMDMTGRTVIVTGAGQGIGRAISEMLLGLGGGVVMVERNPETLRAAAAELGGDGGVTSPNRAHARWRAGPRRARR
jgi:3-oxoacyl-[acyl-carrier protein] reductase